MIVNVFELRFAIELLRGMGFICQVQSLGPIDSERRLVTYCFERDNIFAFIHPCDNGDPSYFSVRVGTSKGILGNINAPNPYKIPTISLSYAVEFLAEVKTPEDLVSMWETAGLEVTKC